MKPIITAFEASPDEGQGLARDMRVRWALEEVRQPYDTQLLSFRQLKQPEHLVRNPFGSIPTYQRDSLVLFESGAIVLHIAERHPGLLPDDPDARARAIMWLFAALNTLEPPIVEREQAPFLECGKPWLGEHIAMIEKRVRDRLGQLGERLGNADWLDGEFSAGDLMMIMVLRRLDGTGILEGFSNLAAYVARGEARPAYKQAFADQAAVFTALSGKEPAPVQR